jgi:hypothetical protein
VAAAEGEADVQKGQKNKISKHFIQGKTFTGFAFFVFALTR